MNFAFEIYIRHVTVLSRYAIPYSDVMIYFACLIESIAQRNCIILNISHLEWR